MAKDAFLPEGEKIPSSGRYMKFTKNENRFRIFSSAITGWELWVEGKPVRNKEKQDFATDELANADINKFTGKKKIPQYFWAFAVFNYDEERVQILEVTQKEVMRGIQDYLADPDYGEDPKKYDLVVIRDEETERVKYRVKAKPPKAFDKNIKEEVERQVEKIDLEALYEGENPFEEEEDPFDVPDEENK